MRAVRSAVFLAAAAFVFAPCASPHAAAETTEDPYADATLWNLSGDYAHFNASSLGAFDYYGATGTAKLPLGSDLALHFEGGYHHVTFNGGDADDLAAGGSFVFERQGWHFGPALGFQSSIGNNLTVNTLNYGGFGQFYASSNLAISGWGGGFHTDAYRWNGFYVSGDAEWYPIPDFSVDPEISFLDAPGGSLPFRESDYIAGFEWRPVSDRQVSIYAAYAYSDFSTRSHANTIFVALRFYDGAGDQTASAPLLVQRYESVDVSPIVSGVVFKY